MGEMLSNWQVALEDFHALRDERPKEEKWELIGGTPVMMPPPTLTHQRICKNLMRMLDARLAVTRPNWCADHEIGVLLVDDDRFNPEPDVTVIDKDYRPGQVYAERFYAVAEVLSEYDKPRVLKLKREFYTGHAHCHAVLLIRQDRIEAELMGRSGGTWQTIVLTDPAAALDLPEIGVIGLLRDLYRDTPLFPR